MEARALENVRYEFDEEERKLVTDRIRVTLKSYTKDEAYRIVCGELDSIGLRSEKYMRELDRLFKEVE